MKEWQFSVMGKLLGEQLSTDFVYRATRYRWRLSCRFSVYPLGDRQFLFKLGSPNDKGTSLRTGFKRLS